MLQVCWACATFAVADPCARQLPSCKCACSGSSCSKASLALLWTAAWTTCPQAERVVVSPAQRLQEGPRPAVWTGSLRASGLPMHVLPDRHEGQPVLYYFDGHAWTQRAQLSLCLGGGGAPQQGLCPRGFCVLSTGLTPCSLGPWPLGGSRSSAHHRGLSLASAHRRPAAGPACRLPRWLPGSASPSAGSPRSASPGSTENPGVGAART